MKKVFILLMVLVVSTSSGVVIAQNFEDLDESHTYYESFVQMVHQGVMVGYEDGLMRPDQVVTRAEYLKMVLEDFSNFPNGEYVWDGIDCFEDMEGHWASKSVCEGKEMGVISGDAVDGLFHPDRPVNFVEGAKIYSLMPMNTWLKYEPFGEWYEPYVLKMQNLKRIPRTVDSMSHMLTRGEVAEILAWIGDGEFVLFYDNEKRRFESPKVVGRMEGLYYESGEEIFVYDDRAGELNLISSKGDDFHKIEFESDEECADFNQFLFLWTDGEKVFQYGDEIEVKIPEKPYLTCLSSSYAYDQNENVYSEPGIGDSKILTDVDFESLELLSDRLVKDKDNVYRQGVALENLDAETFELNEFENLARDKNGYYLVGVFYEKLVVVPIENEEVDFETFEYLGVIGGHIFPTFQFIDNNNLYFRRPEITENGGIQGYPSMLDEIGLPGENDIQDVYYNLKNLETGEMDSYLGGYAFDYDGSYYLFLNDKFLSLGKMDNRWFVGSDYTGELEIMRYRGDLDLNNDLEESVEELLVTIPYEGEAELSIHGLYYLVIGEDAYFSDNKLEGVDTETFEVIQDEYTIGHYLWAKDQNNVYFKGNVVEGAEPEDWERVSGSYFKDKNYLYSDYTSQRLEEIDVENYYLHPDSDRVLMDDDSVYVSYRYLEGADPETFEYINSICMRDKDTFYGNVNNIMVGGIGEEEWMENCGVYLE